jgi:hypothetical protein
MLLLLLMMMMMITFSDTFFFCKETLLLWSLPNMFHLFASFETLNTATVK